MYSKLFDINDSDILENSLNYISDILTQKKVSKSTLIKTELIAEETIVLLLKHAIKGEKLIVKISNFLGDVSVELKLKGEEFDPVVSMENADNDNEDAIRGILLKAYGERYIYSHKSKVNKVRIIVEKGERNTLYLTMIAMGLGLICGFLLTGVAPKPVSDTLCKYILTPIKTMFMNGIHIIIGPVIFFSLVSCIAQFRNLLELGRLATKIMCVYTITTLIATLLGFGMASLLKPGEWGFALKTTVDAADVNIDGSTEVSLLDTIVDIVPSNLLKPFLDSDTLQIMFLAIMIGIAVGMIGEYSAVLKEIFEACNSLFLTVTTMISKFIPLVSFCSVTLMIVELGGKSVKSVVAAALVQILTIGIMICIYGLLIFIIGHLNPIKFFSNAKEGMLTSFTLSSSSAAIPTNMKVCRDKLGIAPKLYNFSIPLGATINMDGTCIFMTSFAMFLARAYAIHITTSSIVSTVIMIMLLSMASPGVPGGPLLSIGVLLVELGIPVEAIGLIIAINPIVDMFDTMNNTTGDMAATLLVAKSEKLLDVDIFNE